MKFRPPAWSVSLSEAIAFIAESIAGEPGDCSFFTAKHLRDSYLRVIIIQNMVKK